MKLHKMLLPCGLVAGILAVGSLRAAPLGTAFTYQGKLDWNGQPATGEFLMRFALYDAPAPGGNLVTGTNLQPVGVTNGLFATDLDFGASVFTGEARWLDLSVSTNNGASFITLLPRVRVAPTPNAIFASSAGTVPSGSIQAGQLATTGAPPGPGQVLGYNGSSLVWQPAGGASSVWSLNGSSAYYTAGNVGIGTPTPSSLYGLDILGGQRVRGDLEVNNGGNFSLGGATSEAGLGTFFILGWAPPGTQNPTRFTVRPNGFVGLGTPTPQARLDVRGDAAINGNLSFGTQTRQMLNLWGTEYGLGVQNVVLYSRAFAGFAWYKQGIHSDATYDPGTNGTRLMTLDSDGLNVNGNTTTKVLTITGGADLAEPFLMKEEHIEKGSVVVIDDEHPGQLRQSVRAYDTRVAGIVSGANGINPGIALKQEGALDQGQNVALTGRVYVKADALFGAIKPGDLLTTSDTPGHAMKVSDHAKSQGAILGKAMSALKDGTGLVLVLVTLQ